MRLDFINQPFEGEGSRVGDHFLRLLSRKENFRRLQVAVAWAKRGGILPIWGALREFRENGGRIEIVVGIDLNGTSIQALRLLRDIAHSVKIFQNTNRRFRPTYHPKLYIFSGPKTASIILGSSNLTQGGLYVNYEQSVRLDLDLSKIDDRRMLESAQDIYQISANAPNGVTRELNDELLDQLIERNLLLDEDTPAARDVRSGDQDSEQTKTSLAPLFGSAEIAPPPASARKPALPARRPEGAASRILARPAVESRQSRNALARKPARVGGFWKALSSWDVNPESAPGQIQIPIQFLKYFPSLHPTPGFENRAKGRQLEASFSLVFIDAKGHSRSVVGARFITYEPKVGHKRPNIESRFTFHDNRIARTLRKDDVLVFEKLDGEDHEFRVSHVTPKNPEYMKFDPGPGKKNRFGEI